MFSDTVNVPSNVTEITVSAEAESSKAKVSGLGTKKLKEGSNKIEISVKAENETVKKYTLNVVRGKSGEVIPEQNGTSDTNQTTPTTPTEYLKSVTIKNHDFDFDPNIFNYNITLGEGEDKLDFLYQAAEGYTVSVEGNENLKNGSIVKLIVKNGEDEREYTFKIKDGNYYFEKYELVK